MPTLTITKTVTYADGTTETPYSMEATIAIQCTIPQRNQFTLSTGSATQIFENGRMPFSTGKVAYIAIFNTGANSAYVGLLDDAGGNGTFHEIPAGAMLDLFGEDISITGADKLQYIYAKGDTTVEVDAFM